MQALGFDNYAGVMKVYLSKYRVVSLGVWRTRKQKHDWYISIRQIYWALKRKMMMKNLERGRRRNGRMQRRERENQVVMSLQSEESVTESEEGGWRRREIVVSGTAPWVMNMNIEARRDLDRFSIIKDKLYNNVCTVHSLQIVHFYAVPKTKIGGQQWENTIRCLWIHIIMLL